MPTVYPSAPFHDDFDETKQFYRVLFKPGRAVQARELTQLQTMLQAQIERFGNNIFKEGSIVIPGNFVYDPKYSYVKLQEVYNSTTADAVLATLVGQKIIGRSSGVVGLVVNYQTSTTTDAPTLYIKYVGNGSNGSKTKFDDNEIIDNVGSSISVRAVDTDATGFGSAFSISQGVIFVKGTFAYFSAQTKIVSKYSSTPTLIVGFDITETNVTSDDDNTLLDPAVGSFNFFAPGADRYKIGLNLGTRPFTTEDDDDPNFVELVRVQDGDLISSKADSSYNILQDTIARRTYDESGDYVVKPFRLKIRDHLRSSNANVTYTVSDGLYTSAQGGNADLFVGVVDAGKAYVRGYEIDSIRTKYVAGLKARDFVSVNNGTVSTSIGNYIYIKAPYSIPSLSSIGKVDLYSDYTSANGTASGTKVGTARVKHIEFYSGTIGSTSAIYKAYLFDIQMITGYTFENDVKQLYYVNSGLPNFTSNISASLISLTGSVTATSGSNSIVGSGTLFTTELSVNDYININSNSYKIQNVVNNNLIYINRNAVSTSNTTIFYKENASINDANLNSLVFEFPYNTIKTVDPTNLETLYTTRRVYTRTLSGGNTSITAGTDETFSGVSSDNYTIVINSGGNAGSYIVPSGNVSRSGTPTGKVVTLSLSGYGYTNEDITIVTTVQKTQSAADKKIKTLVSGYYQDYTTEADCTSSKITLGKADIYRFSNVRMSANAFGSSYYSPNSIDITDRFVFDNGQRPSFYDLGSLTLKPNAGKPTGPIRIYYDYFTHGSGDYFSVNSYVDIDYKDIPEFTFSNKTYKLRDCLDFRPRISDDGSSFTAAGSSTSEMLDFENDLITDYQYYLPRIDKVVLTSEGKIKIVQGLSSLEPKEPLTPDNSMALYILKQNPYVFNVNKDIELIPIDNKRYTMRDIGRIENRVKNLEYYTSLSLLEKDTQLFQIKDSLGFDRFKNGFVVDSFRGHGIGDVYNRDYSVAIDFNKNEARPLCESTFFKLAELNTTSVQRSSNNYAKVGDFILPAYTEEVFISNSKSSKTEFLNPFNVVSFNGIVKLTPPADNWFEVKRLPDVIRNTDGNYDSVVSEARARGTYGTVWGSWRDFGFGNNGNELIQQREGIEYTINETIETTTKNDVVVSKVVIPKMRDVTIKFQGEGLKPNANVFVFFGGLNVTNDCVAEANITPSANVVIFPTSSFKPITVDYTGNVTGYFHYSSTKYNLSTGNYTLRITDSSINNINDQTTFGEAIFTSTGELTNVKNEIISTRNATLASSVVTDTRTTYIESAPSEPVAVEPATNPAEPVVTVTPINIDEEEVVVKGPDVISPESPPRQEKDLITLVYEYGFGREPDPEGYDYWNTIARDKGITDSDISNMTVSTENIKEDGSIAVAGDPGEIFVPLSYNNSAEKVYDLIRDIMYTGIINGEVNSQPNSMIAEHYNYHSSAADAVSAAASAMAIQITTAVANPTSVGNFYWSADAEQAKLNGLNENVSWSPDSSTYR